MKKPSAMLWYLGTPRVSFLLTDDRAASMTGLRGACLPEIKLVRLSRKACFWGTVLILFEHE